MLSKEILKKNYKKTSTAAFIGNIVLAFCASVCQDIYNSNKKKVTEA